RYENGDPIKIHGIVIDVTERIENERKQIEFANKDVLTGLSNSRKLLKDMIKRRNGIGLFFDLDDFKKFNDIYGHHMGDKILNEFGQALKEAALELPEVYIYRLYGDEFFVYAEGYDEDFANAYEQRLVVIIEERMSKYNLKLKLQASMGSANFKKDSDIDDFIKEADYEMYKIKIDKKAIRKKPSR
ncbi:MAG: GGDEF domain-containing protein, partial [Tenericutes bacterium]|nr:GGDEF domain-containing protein [Mycoplasmatota bacterium]